MFIEITNHPRLPAHYIIKCKFSDMNEFIDYTLKNISMGGVFIQAVNPPPLNAAVTMQLSLSDSKVITLKGKVVRVKHGAHQERGCALEFEKMDEKERKAISQLLMEIPAEPSKGAKIPRHRKSSKEVTKPIVKKPLHLLLKEQKDPEGIRSILGLEYERLKRLTAYETLELNPSAPAEEIKRHYHQIKSRYSPCPFEDSDFQVKTELRSIIEQIEVAYRLLRTPELRAHYDAELERKKKEKKKFGSGQFDQELDHRVEFERGRQLLFERKYEEAKKAFAVAYAVDKNNAKYAAYLGWSLLTLGEAFYDEARYYLTESLVLDEKSEMAHFALGHLDQCSGDFEAAAEHYKRAFELNPKNRKAQEAYILLSKRAEKSAEDPKENAPDEGPDYQMGESDDDEVP